MWSAWCLLSELCEWTAGDARSASCERPGVVIAIACSTCLTSQTTSAREEFGSITASDTASSTEIRCAFVRCSFFFLSSYKLKLHIFMNSYLYMHHLQGVLNNDRTIVHTHIFQFFEILPNRSRMHRGGRGFG